MNRHTDGQTNQLIESIGPKGRCFENNQCVRCYWKINEGMLKHRLEDNLKQNILFTTSFILKVYIKDAKPADNVN